MHFFQVQEKRLEAAREEERMLEQRRQFEEEQGPGADQDAVNASKAALGVTTKDQVHETRSYIVLAGLRCPAGGWGLLME